MSNDYINNYDGLLKHPDRIKKIFQDVADVLNEAKKEGVNLGYQVSNIKNDAKQKYDSLERDNSSLRKEQQNAYSLNISDNSRSFNSYSDMNNDNLTHNYALNDSIKLKQSKQDLDMALNTLKDMQNCETAIEQCAQDLFQQNKMLSDFFQDVQKMNMLFEACMAKLGDIKRNSTNSSSIGNATVSSDLQGSSNNDNFEARQKILEYMNTHGYTKEDFFVYSQDPEWRELQLAACPDFELPPLGEEKSISISEYFEDGTEYDKKFADNNYTGLSSYDVSDLNKNEINCFKNYTAAAYSGINKALYDESYNPGSSYAYNNIRKHIDIITDCIDRKFIPENVTLYRGIGNISAILGNDIQNLSLEEVNEKYKGEIFINKGFSSVSTDINVANRFAQGIDSGILVINTPKGAKGMSLGSVSEFEESEKEILLQRSSAFYIESISCDKQNKWRIDVNLIASY